jgi:hypothetical protein
VGTMTRSVIVGGRDSTIAVDDSVVLGRNCHVTTSTGIFVNADTVRRLKHGVGLAEVPQNTGTIALQAEDMIYAFSNIDMRATFNVVNTSDRREKADIEPLELGLDAVLQMKPRQFYYVVDEGKLLKFPKTLGFVAQELEEVHPGLVIRESNRRKLIDYRKRVHDLEDKTPTSDELFSVDTPEEQEKFRLAYSTLIPVLAQAIKDQNVLITQLQSRVSELERFHIHADL